MSIELKPGDELVISRRRTTTTKDKDGADVISQDTVEISKVQLQSDEARVIIGGGVEDRWVDDKRYISIMLETRK